MKTIQLFIILSFIVLLVSCKKDPTTPSGYEQEILDAINAHRADLGLAPLVSNDFIYQIAHAHCQDMADGKVPFGYDGQTERSDQITKQFGAGSVAENVAWGQGSGTEILNNWLQSVGLKENIEGKFELTGLSAVRTKDGNYYYSQIFYKKN
jgi:uncharacterized protein YkwD